MRSVEAQSSSLLMELPRLQGNWTSSATARSFPPEMRLLLACCVWPHSEARLEQVSVALKSALNWDSVVRLAERHRVVGLVHHAFSHLPPEAIPEIISQSITDKAGLLAQQSLRMAAESVRIAALMEDVGVPIVFLKGVPLAIAAYGRLGLRHSRDIDLLAPEEAALSACRALMNAGYSGATPAERLTTEVQLKRWFRDNRKIGYLHQNSGIYVELHVRLFPNPLLNQVLGPEYWEQVPLGGQSLPALSWQELMLYLCVHGAVHAWFRLKWLADIGALLSQASEDKIRQLVQAAEKLEISLPVQHAMQLSSDLLGTQSLTRTTTPSWRENLLGRISLQEILCESDQQDMSFRHYIRTEMCPYLLRSDWHYLVQQLRCDARSEADRQLVPLPEALSFLYVILRPFLWLTRYVASRCRVTVR